MIYVIVGPTGSGKTSVANRLGAFLNAPIINADAFQIYKEMDIGTAKLSKTNEFYKRYHLLDLINPDESFSVKDYQDIFRKTLNELLKENDDIVVCGGTGLYIRAALYDYNFEESVDDVSDLEQLDNDSLYDLLLKLDPKASENIHKNNRKRVIRAISIARTSILKKSENIDSQNHELVYKNVRFLMLNPDRKELYERCNLRVDEMFKKGLIDETKYLLNKYNFSRTASQAIGYKEVIGYLNGDYDYQTCVEMVKQRTRNYAKRQWTFFNHQLPVKKFCTPSELLKDLGIDE